MLSRRDFLAAATAAPAAAPLAAAPAKPRPNILFLMADQHRAQAVGAMGNPDVQTPHLDRLAGEGVLLRHTFANSPVCCPARANILTGQYTHRNGMVANDLRLRENVPSLAASLANAGYRTGFVGKWHLDGGPRLPGFIPPGPRRRGYQFWAANECHHDHFHNTYFRDDPEPRKLGKFEAEGWADLGVEFLEAARSDARPFFLSLQWGPPHDPYKAPPEYARLYDSSKLEMRRNWQSRPGVPGPSEIAQYYAMVTAVDDQVGRLMKVLDSLGLRDNTIVLYSSDHGDMLGSHGQILKRKPWEESIRVPGILRWPEKIRAGQKSDLFFSHVDFAPTLLGMAGVKTPREMQGQDLSRAILGGDTRPKETDSAFFQIFGPYAGDHTEAGWRGVRTPNWLYARYRERPWVLYDMRRDPNQLRNLAPDRPAALGEMDKLLTEWMGKTGDKWSYNWTAPVEDGGRLFRDKTYFTVEEYVREKGER